jgi:hypothetical protein
MKRAVLADLGILIVLVFICVLKSFAQLPEQKSEKPANAFSFLTIIKLDELSSKDDMVKVKEALRSFGYRVHSHKINFERKQVLIRMRQEIPTEALIEALKSAGYTAWFDPKEKIQPADAEYRGSK